MSNTFAPDYVDVATRVAEFRAKHPDGSLQPANLAEPFRIETISGDTYVVVVAAAYRGPDDPRPGVGMAYEAYPGKTPYTRGSELQNAETSAWGRAIMAALAADSRRGIATADEIRNRTAERQMEPPRPQSQDWKVKAAAATDTDGLRAVWRQAVAAGDMNDELAQHLTGLIDGMKPADDPWQTPLPVDVPA